MPGVPKRDIQLIFKNKRQFSWYFSLAIAEAVVFPSHWPSAWTGTVCCDMPVLWRAICQSLISIGSIPSFLRQMTAFRSRYSVLQRKASGSSWHDNVTVFIVEAQKLTFLSGFSFPMIELNRLTGNSNTWLIRENAVFWNVKLHVRKVGVFFLKMHFFKYRKCSLISNFSEKKCLVYELCSQFRMRDFFF